MLQKQETRDAASTTELEDLNLYDGLGDREAARLPPNRRELGRSRTARLQPKNRIPFKGDESWNLGDREEGASSTKKPKKPTKGDREPVPRSLQTNVGY
jgi:hypothetical protein